MMFRTLYYLAVFCLIFNTVRLPVVGISVSDVFVLAAVASWVYLYVRDKGKNGWGVPLHPLYAPAVLVLLGGLVSSMFAYSPLTSLAVTLKIVFVLTLWISMTMVMIRHGELMRVLDVFLAAIFVTSMVAVVDRITGGNIGGAISGRVVPVWGRSDGTLGHPVELGFLTSVGVPLALGMFLNEWREHGRRLVLGLRATIFIVILVTVFLSGTVAGWLSTAVSLCVFLAIFIVRLRSDVRFALLLFLVIALGGGTLYVTLADSAAPLRQLIEFDLGRATGKTGPGRFAIMQEALGVISRYPFVGVGMDQTGTGNLPRDVLATSDLVHNPILSGWMGGGIIVFVGFAWCYLIVGLTALNAVWRGVQRDNWILLGLGACVLGWLVFDQSQPHLYHRYTWLTLAIVFGLGLYVRVPSWIPKQKASVGTSQPLSLPTISHHGM